MMRVKLRVRGGSPAIVPPAISGREVNGEPRPAAGTMPSVEGGLTTTVIPAAHETTNIGPYVPPPKNPIWTPIPAGIRPTKPCAKC